MKNLRTGQFVRSPAQPKKFLRQNCKECDRTDNWEMSVRWSHSYNSLALPRRADATAQNSQLGCMNGLINAQVAICKLTAAKQSDLYTKCRQSPLRAALQLQLLLLLLMMMMMMLIIFMCTLMNPPDLHYSIFNPFAPISNILSQSRKFVSPILRKSSSS